MSNVGIILTNTIIVVVTVFMWSRVEGGELASGWTRCGPGMGRTGWKDPHILLSFS